jgi:hypothetical protein
MKLGADKIRLRPVFISGLVRPQAGQWLVFRRAEIFAPISDDAKGAFQGLPSNKRVMYCRDLDLTTNPKTIPK